jgi:hypothetical protein
MLQAAILGPAWLKLRSSTQAGLEIKANLKLISPPAMAVLNRCAIAVAPKPPMREWSRRFWSREDREGYADEQSLYLIPTYDDETSALELLSSHYEAIFTAELDLWCVDDQLWPSPRSFDLFQRWFSLRLFPLVDDLGLTPLITYTVPGSFRDSVREALG